METHAEEPFEIDHDEAEDEQSKDFEAEVVEVPDPGGYRAQIARQSAESNRLAARADMMSNAAQTHNRLTADPLKVPDVAVADPTPSPGLEAKKEALKKASEQLGKSQHTDSAWTVSSYLVAALGMVATGISVFPLVDYLTRKARERPTDDIPTLDDKTKAVLDQLSSDWKTMSDHDYWERLATYVEAHHDKMSLGDQIVFMNLTVMLGGYSNGFLWDSTQDMSDGADRLLKVYQTEGGSPPMIRAAATLTYHEQPVPRVVAAELLRLALASIGVQASGKLTT